MRNKSKPFETIIGQNCGGDGDPEQNTYYCILQRTLQQALTAVSVLPLLAKRASAYSLQTEGVERCVLQTKRCCNTDRAHTGLCTTRYASTVSINRSPNSSVDSLNKIVLLLTQRSNDSKASAVKPFRFEIQETVQYGLQERRYYA